MGLKTGNFPICTCSCIDCIEGNHCGGDYMVEHTAPDGTIAYTCVGVCHYPRLEDEPDEWWEDDDEWDPNFI